DKQWLIHLMKPASDGDKPATDPDERDKDGADVGGGDADDDAAASGDDAGAGAVSSGRGVRPPKAARAAARGHAAPPARVEAPRPMLATLGEASDLRRPEEWALEMKWDGIRAVVVVEDDGVRLVSRRGHDMTAAYPELADAA